MNSRLAYRATALGPLAKIDWTIPPGVSAVVGPNRVGKSTLLRLPEFVRIALDDGLNEAAKQVFDGTIHLRNLAAAPDQPSTIGVSSDNADWDAELTIEGATLSRWCAERLSVAEHAEVQRERGALDGVTARGKLRLGDALIPLVLVQRIPNRRSGEPLTPELVEATREALGNVLPAEFIRGAISLGARAAYARSYRTYHYQLIHLLKYGSVHSSDLELQVTGENVFPLLRNWRDSGDHEDRFEFVMTTLREAFPHVKRVDFEQAGQTVTMAIHDTRWSGKRVPIARESTGLITALLQLCAVASGHRRSLVTIDELETSLHPHAIRTLMAAFRRWATEKDLRIVLATQSETVLDQFREEPGQVFVIEPKQETSPRALTEMFSPEWLSQFSLGDLFSHLEFGSNGEVLPA